MKRLALFFALAAAVIAPVAAAADLQTARLTQAGGATFPSRAFVLTLPKRMQLTPDRVHVLENGQPVVGLEVLPAEQTSRGQFGVVLAIDASDSMRGAPIAAAVRAARAFVARRSPNQQVAILTFSNQTNVLVPFTTDSSVLERALSSPPKLAVGTHIYDGVEAALELLANAQIAAGSIVVLSDGSDTGSRLKESAAVQAARDKHVRLFTVGLRSKQFSPTPLRTLADMSGGEYAEASRAADLTQIYGALGSRLSNEYLLHYRSLAGPGVPVNVTVSIDALGATAPATYTTPALPLIGTPPYHPSVVDKAIQSTLVAVVVSVLAAVLVSVGLSALLRPRKRDLRHRVSEFVSIGHQPEAEDEEHSHRASVLEGAERSLARTRWWAEFKEELDIAEISMPAIQVVLWTLVGAIALGWILAQVAGATLFAVFGLLVPLLVREVIQRKVRRKRSLFAEQLPDNLQVLASALRAGHGLVGALSVVVDDASEPTKSEFRRVIADERLGVPLEDAFAVVVRRMQSRDLEQVALVAALQRQTGGNSAEVLDRVVQTLRERADLRRLVKTLTSQGRMARWILTGIPVGLSVAISILSPGYLDPLFNTPGGRFLLGLAAAMLITGSLIIRKIIDIKL